MKTWKDLEDHEVPDVFAASFKRKMQKEITLVFMQYPATKEGNIKLAQIMDADYKPTFYLFLQWAIYKKGKY